MRENAGDRLFSNEREFILWLTTLLEASPSFQQVTVEPLISRPSSPLERMLRADILAIRKFSSSSETLIIECKNRPLFGAMIDETISQISRYGNLRPGVKLVLALPSRLTPADAERLKAANIELWDIDEIGRIFRQQITTVSPQIKDAFNGGPAAETAEQALIRELKECIPGRAHWSVYQKLVGRIVEHLFCPPLNTPLSESPDESGVNRRDFILANFAEQGFWNFIRTRYAADYIVVDAKNYSGKVKKRDVLQMANYLRPHGAGLFGLIISRNGGDTSAWITAREQWAHYQKLVLILDDSHCEAMLTTISSGEATSILAKQIQDFRLSM